MITTLRRYAWLWIAGPLVAMVLMVSAISTQGAANAAEIRAAKVAWTVSLQSVEVAPDVKLPAVSRDSYSVSVVSVVQYPLAGGASVPISSGFGPRKSPCAGCSSHHMGIDYTPGGGAPIMSVADGVVTQAGVWFGLGYCVTVSHLIDGVAVQTVYGHMIAGSIRVAAGQIIPRGTVLGLVGDTGESTGNHLHFEVHVNNTPVDPYAWITAHENLHIWQ